jgi:hypothetical protein
LMIPDDAVLPLKAIITFKVKDEQIRLRMINAITSEI